jgi:hypothetical protein
VDAVAAVGKTYPDRHGHLEGTALGSERIGPVEVLGPRNYSVEAWSSVLRVEEQSVLTRVGLLEFHRH